MPVGLHRSQRRTSHQQNIVPRTIERSLDTKRQIEQGTANAGGITLLTVRTQVRILPGLPFVISFGSTGDVAR
jgi:hypothetical protein